jgi:hypothetical protein
VLPTPVNEHITNRQPLHHTWRHLVVAHLCGHTQQGVAARARRRGRKG